ncbi:hypothetical protein CAT36_00275 [Acinetobacter pittii]|uniref:hypothetical protein n=1 Tax=Acinetobacter pittii TaxID=48296 RepID=UPI000B6D8687|nr:hypothetical protein [Acinetobacter pittii]OTU54436.1 hypothetical protein CAT36_00275 [Acinetobacter pittii]
MNRRKLNLLALLLWGLVAYAIALLTYCTMQDVFHSSVENISAFGSILGGCGAFFAAFVAIYLFNDWRETEDFKRILSLHDQCFKVMYENTNTIEDILINLSKNPKFPPSSSINQIIRTTYGIIAYVAMDYNESLKKDKKLRELIEILILINKKFTAYHSGEEILSYGGLDVFYDGIIAKLDEMSKKT